MSERTSVGDDASTPGGGSGARDRDVAGRARNARPRDALGRPLPRGAEGVERLPDDLALPPAESLVEAQRLLDLGLPFQAHEVLEGTWKGAPPSERELWRGLAQLAVGLTHLMRGNDTGAVALLRRGAERVGDYAAAPPHGIAAGALAEWARRLAADVPRGVTVADRPPPRLTGPGHF